MKHIDYLHIHGPAYLPVHLHPAWHILAGYLHKQGKTADICYSSIDALSYILKQDTHWEETIKTFSSPVHSLETYKHFVAAKLRARKILQNYSHQINQLFNWQGKNEVFDYVHNHLRYKARFDPETIAWLVQTAQHPQANIFAQYIHEELIPYLQKIQPKAIGFTITDKQQASFPMVLAGLLKTTYKDTLPHTKIGIGWYLLSINKENLLNSPEALQLFEYIDFVIHNEWEKAINAYIDYLDGKIAIDQVPKLIYKADNQMHANSLDENWLIIPDNMQYLEPEDLSTRPYYNDQHIQKLYLPSWGEVSLVMVRWCPYACSFCGIFSGYDKKASDIDNKKRKKQNQKPLFHKSDLKKNFKTPDQTPVQEVFTHMQHFYKTLWVKTFSFSDERLPPTAMKELANCIIDAGMTDITRSWYNTLDKEFLDPEFCALVSKAWFKFPQFGLETISRDALKASTKGQNISTLQQQAEMFKNCNTHGIRPHIFLMIGLPKQSNIDLLATIAYLHTIGDTVLTIKPTTTKVTKASTDAIYPEKVGITLKSSKDFGANILFENDTNAAIARISRNLIDAWKIVFDQRIALRHKYNPVTKHLSYTHRLHTWLDTVVDIATQRKQAQEEGELDPSLNVYDGDPFDLGEETINKAYKKVIRAILDEYTTGTTSDREDIIPLAQALYLVSDKSFVEQTLKQHIHDTHKRNEILDQLPDTKPQDSITLRTQVLTYIENAGKKEVDKIFT